MSRIPLLLNPVTLMALFVLVANDHWLKVAHPGLVSGKASDFAGLVLLPMLVLGAMKMARLPAGERTACVVCGLTGLAFIAVKLFAVPNSLSAPLLGGQVLMDPWDLMALPALAVPVFVVGRNVVPVRVRSGPDRG